jgi:hypothetical protein
MAAVERLYVAITDRIPTAADFAALEAPSADRLTFDCLSAFAMTARSSAGLAR